MRLAKELAVNDLVKKRIDKQAMSLRYSKQLMRFLLARDEALKTKQKRALIAKALKLGNR